MNSKHLEHGFRMISAGIPLLTKGMKLTMFPLSGFFCNTLETFLVDPATLSRGTLGDIDPLNEVPVLDSQKAREERSPYYCLGTLN